MTRRPWKAIAAMARNRVIGAQNSIPWHFPEDFQWFKERTLGATVVMGRLTYESIGRPLPKRTTVVISRQHRPDSLPEQVFWCSSLDAVETLKTPDPLWLCGGSQLYSQGLHRCHELYLTLIDIEPEGDAVFPPYEALFPRAELLRQSGPLAFWKFSR